MRMYDIIEKKRYMKELSKEEIEFFVKGYSDGKIPDYQASALLMAICINGLTNKELVYLTFAMANSAKRLDLSAIKRPGQYIVDKHSTGGVGDKVTLIVLPIVAALGVDVCKMSGRGLGFTGGTADKLESIVGYDVNIPLDEAIEQVKKIGVCLISQSEDIAVADKKIYALRDTTATVESIDLIASSIMSKKIAAGAEKILLDVTVGSGAFMKNLDDAKKLARTMVDIGKLAGVETKAVITSMEEPLGKCVGNALEMKEVIEFLLSDETALMDESNKDLREVVFEIAAYMLQMSGIGKDIEQNKRDVLRCITSGKAYDKFIGLVNAQSSGCILSIDSKKIGEALVCLGGGRIKKGDDIDYAVGFEFLKKVGDNVGEGEPILKVIYNDKEKFDEAFSYIQDAIVIENVSTDYAKNLKDRRHVLDIVE